MVHYWLVAGVRHALFSNFFHQTWTTNNNNNNSHPTTVATTNMNSSNVSSNNLTRTPVFVLTHRPTSLPSGVAVASLSQTAASVGLTLERWRSLANANLPQLLAQTTVVGRWRGRRRGLPELALPCIRTRHGLHQRPLLADTDTVTAGRSSALAVALAAWQLEENDCIGSEQMVAGEAPLKSSRQL
jgi:hypothetical protein